jgi:two-component system phosphate regulon response regulator PhoB
MWYNRITILFDQRGCEEGGTIVSMRTRLANTQAEQQVFRAADLTLDLRRKEIKGCNGNNKLTPKECELLALFMSYPGRVLSRKLLMKEVWETDFLDDTRTLEVHICWLRKKIEEDPRRPQRLRTVRGVGYRFG